MERKGVDFEFDPVKHEYRKDGQLVRSVTQILGEWILVNGYYVNVYNPKIVIAESVMRDAQDHGTAVHEGVNLLLTQGLDWDVLHPALVNPLRQFLAWRNDYPGELVSTGYKMFSEKYRYAGTPDPFYVLRFGKRDILCFVEIKTGEHLLVGPQLSAYVQLYRERSKYKGPIQRWVLELPKTGDYSFMKCENTRDWDFFHNCLLRNAFIDRITHAAV